MSISATPTINLPFSPEDVRTGKAREALPFRCCGCGAEAAGNIKPCDCATMVGYRGQEHCVFVFAEDAKRDRLAAAAPNLLAALKDLRDAVHSGGFPHEAVKRADAAIAKASA
jgi:hypothetical protein